MYSYIEEYKNIDDFNEHWKEHLEPGFEGLSFTDNSGEVVSYLNKKFKELSEQYPDFTYSQIKIKFGKSRAYIHGVPFEIEDEIETALDIIIENS